jgi:hypothetical protein
MPKVFKLLSVGALALATAACGGRASEEVPLERSFDGRLSCDHLEAEYDVNLKKAEALVGERSSETANNFGLFLLSPIFMDFSGVEKKEIEALAGRNAKIIRLMNTKNCSDIPTLEPPADASPGG